MSASRERLLWADVDVGMFTVPEELLRPWVYDLEAFILELTGLGLVSCWALRIASLIFKFVAGVAWMPFRAPWDEPWPPPAPPISVCGMLPTEPPSV